jgi:8-oxo-dGTP diphosphatase
MTEQLPATDPAACAAPAASLPYRIAVLCYLFDAQGRVLLLHRRRPPNRDLYSPIGGKLEQDHGESPTACAVREIHEEVGLDLQAADLHLTGIVSEAGYEDACHWLMFLYEVTRPVVVTRTRFDEGLLEWHTPDAIADLPIPQTDRQIIWPLFWQHRGGFFAAHIHCHGGHLSWRLEQSAARAETV